MNHQYLVGFNLQKIPVEHRDVVIVGGGIAGLTAAVVAARDLKVEVLAKSGLKQTSTWYAQGGIAAPLAADDSAALHIKDTLEAGSGLCDPQAVQVLVNEAALAVAMLLELGTGFDSLDGVLQLGREGGHSVSRVVHAGDATGSVVARSLSEAVGRNSNISFRKDVFVIDLLVDDGRCRGVLVFDESAGGLVVYLAAAVVLAAGGMGQVYEATTNPSGATGDGQAMAERKGVELSGFEFIQFHPTALQSEANPRFLITEVLRGEGAYLRDASGERFMVGRHPLAELAPRDMVCQSLVEVARRDGIDHVYLDARHIPADRLKSRFPVIWAHCLERGFDLAKDLVPVMPAAHYMIGGLRTDLYGRTSVPGLYASGEVASTGVHGANRLASNSLLEGVVFSRRIGQVLLDEVEPGASIDRVPALSVASRKVGESLDWLRPQLQHLMNENVSVVRTVAGLEEAAAKLGAWAELLDYEYQSQADWETVNMLTVSTLIVVAALARRQSLGVHLVVD